MSFKNIVRPHFYPFSPSLISRLCSLSSLMEQLSFNQTIPFGPLLGLAYKRYFSRPVIWVVYAVGMFNLIMLLSGEDGTPNTSLVMIMAMILVVLPLFVYLNTRALYTTSSFFEEEMEIEVNGKHIQVQNEVMSLTYKWEGIYQIREYRNWIMIYTNRFTALYLYRPAVDQTDWAILRAILRGLSNEVEVRLKK